MPVLFALSLAIVFACGCVGMFAALRLGNGEAVQGMFPLFFVFLFLSSMALPRDMIEQDWFQTVATLNPFSYLIEGVRSLFVDGLRRRGAGARVRVRVRDRRRCSSRPRPARCGLRMTRT